MEAGIREESFLNLLTLEPSYFLNISVARWNFPYRFGIFLEPSKPDGMTLRFLK